MNRNLLLFGLFLVLLGILFEFYLISVIGLILLVPAAIAPSRVPTRPTQTPPKQEARRIIPPPKPQAMPEPQPQPTQQPQSMIPLAMAPSANPNVTYSPALFPNSIFPSVMPYGTGSSAPLEPVPKKQERDELVEAGAMLALLRLLLG